MDAITKKDIPRPLLKWVGGKGQIIDKLIKRIPKEMNNYHEIFVGGGSFLIMILWAQSKGYITIKGSSFIDETENGIDGNYCICGCNKCKYLFKSSWFPLKEIILSTL